MLLTTRGPSRTLVATALTMLSLLALSTQLAAAETAVEWTVAPADTSGPDGRISLRHEIDPGASTTDHIAITNLGTSTTEYLVQAGDGLLGANGAFDITSAEPTDSGSWIAIDGVEDGRVSLAAGETRVLPLTITVPPKATPGDHPAGIVVGVPTAADGVTVTHRIGVRLHLRVAGEVTPQLTVRGVETSFAPSLIPFGPGVLTVRYEVENAGNVRLGAASKVHVTGPFGLTSTTTGNPAVELLPGDRTPQQAELTAWPLVMLFGHLDVAATTIGDDSTSLPDAIRVEFDSSAVTWSGVVVLVLLLLLVAVAVRRRR